MQFPLRIRILLVFLWPTMVVCGQTNWVSIETKITQELNEKKISADEWYLKLMKETGRFSDLKLWTLKEKTEKITETAKNEVKLYFPKNFQLVKANGNKYAKVYLENATTNSVEVSRIDATIGNVQEYFLIDSKWVMFRENSTSSCGNSYFTSLLPPGERLLLELDNHFLVDGPNKLSYKIKVLIGQQWIVSNVIKVGLYESQLKRLRESIAQSK